MVSENGHIFLESQNATSCYFRRKRRSCSRKHIWCAYWPQYNFGRRHAFAGGPLYVRQPEKSSSLPPPGIIVRSLKQTPFREVKIHQSISWVSLASIPLEGKQNEYFICSWMKCIWLSRKLY